MRVGIVGAGPAGLTAALAAKALGLSPAIFEQAHDLGRAGGGIAIQPNGLGILDALGVLDALRSRICPVDGIVLQRADGSVLGRFDYGDLALRHRYLAILLRCDLQEHLLAAALHNGIPVHLGQRCVGVRPEKGGALLHFASGLDYECDVVLGADGVHSAVRTLLAIPARLRALGLGALRGAVDVACSASVSREIWGSDGRLFGIAPLPDSRTYFYCSAPVGQWPAILDHGLPEWLEGWHAYGAEVRDILRAVTDWSAINYDEIREARAKRWYRLPAFLVGDAAHAMAPNWGQGANCAMVDGFVLTHLLARAHREGRGLEDVGPRYEAVRRRFVGLLQTGSRIAARMPGWRWPAVKWWRDLLLRGQDRVRWSKRRTLALVAGYNRKEQVFLGNSAA